MAEPSAHASCLPRPHRLLGAARPLEPIRSGHVILPLSSGDKIAPGKVSFVHSRPQNRHLLSSRVLVADPQKWRISSLRTGPRIGGYQVRGDHPALSDPGPESVARLPALPVEDGVELAVEYVGSEALGEPLVACLCAESDADLESDEVRSLLGPAGLGNPGVSFRAESRRISPGEQVRLPLPARAHDLHIWDLTLRVDEPTHWLVSDVLVNGDTLLVESGDLPGELLADRPGRAPLRLGRLRASEDLVVQATYVGPSPSASLSYEVSGSEIPTRDAAGDSALLPMSSGVPVLGIARVWARVGLPREYAFLPEEVVLRDPEKWVVVNVKVGHMSQLAQNGDAPGSIFGTRTRGCQLNFSAVPGDVDLTLDIKYVGADPAGEPVICGVVGRVARLPVASLPES